jgi:hypothetical protein
VSPSSVDSDVGVFAGTPRRKARPGGPDTALPLRMVDVSVGLPEADDAPLPCSLT